MLIGLLVLDCENKFFTYTCLNEINAKYVLQRQHRQ